MKPGRRNILILYFSFVLSFAYENLSSLKKATQSSRNNDTNSSPARAVDKDITTCSSTGADNPAWWYVDLGKIKSIHDIQVNFYGKNTADEQRQRELMYGYQLYVSNTTNLQSLDMMHHCYNNSGPALLDVSSNYVCISFGRYVIFYNERIPGVTYPNSTGMIQNFTYVQLCEILVFGCDTPGTYGSSCIQRCPSKCQEDRCHIINGTCLGCMEGLTGDKCEHPCSEGYYGLECRGICSNNCLENRTCNHVTGNCDNGCSDGWTGGRCNITCTMGTYGAGCSKNCSGNCKNDTSCNRVTGFCDNGCSPGYIGTRCDQVCTPGTYGIKCVGTCSGNCVNGTTCNATTGACDLGCSPGYIGGLCDQECPVGTFGENCTGSCSRNCLNNETCSNVDGRCKNGCKIGFQGVLCDKSCTEGTYGDCKQNCSGQCANNETCNYLDGKCTNGCNPGYQGEKCSFSCSSGLYGQNCSYICSENCKDAKCDHVYGNCSCKQGWRGSDCSTECSNGTFGENCLRNCSGHCSNNETCSKTNGECPNGCQSNYKGVTCQELKSPKENSQDVLPEPVIIGIGVSVLLLVIIIIVLLLRRRYRHSKNSHGIHSSQIELINTKTELHSYENDIAKSGGEKMNITIKDFLKTKEKMFENDSRFKAEYEQIPNGELHPCDAGKKEENKIKNRYKTTFPYDHSRVKLQVENMRSDYINANYIKDISGEQRYIATQGPKKETMADFWAMIWQESVKVIVCLTNLKEGKQKKCQQYWPNCHDKIQNGNFAIRNQEEKEYSNYIKRHLRLQDTISKAEKDVWMFHYTQWPDHGVPEAINLVVFHRHVQRVFDESPDKSKIVVHCSAGLGRTGTFIALDALYRNGSKPESVNVFEYVTQMRHDRMNMVQGEDQYKMIYTALYETVRGDLRPVTAESFLSNHQTLNCKHQEDDIKKEQETGDFKELTLLKIQYDATERSAQNSDASNFTPTVMPVEKYRCHLLSDDDKPVYYNAVILQSFTKPDGLISAQYPLVDQCEDFLYLVKESRAGTVLFLGPLEDIPSTKIWFPSKNDSKSVGKFTIKLTKCDPSTVVPKTNIIIQGKGIKDIPLSVLECNFWKGDALTADCRRVLEAIKETRLEESTHPNKRTIVFSSDGARRCGPFCVAYNVIEQFILDKEIDIFTATRLIQIRRPEFISTPEEYQFCHDLVAEYLQADTLYDNLNSKH